MLKGKRDRAILAVFFHGLRREELCKLRVEDVEQRRGVAHLHIHGKGGEIHCVPAHPAAPRVGFFLRLLRRKRPVRWQPSLVAPRAENGRSAPGCVHAPPWRRHARVPPCPRWNLGRSRRTTTIRSPLRVWRSFRSGRVGKPVPRKPRRGRSAHTQRAAARLPAARCTGPQCSRGSSRSSSPQVVSRTRLLIKKWHVGRM